MIISETYNEQLVTEDKVHSKWYDSFVSQSNRPPSVFIVGAQKGGTTSLVNLMSKHSQIIAPKIKEHYYFSNQNYNSRGISWYLKQFHSSDGERGINIDATANYLESEIAPSLLKKEFPNAKIIVLLRNPADRAFSQYKMAVKYGFETQTFEKALEFEEERLRYSKSNYVKNYGHDYGFQRLGYRAKGIYHQQISSWQKHFSESQMLIIQSEALFSNVEFELTKIFSFIGLHNEKFRELEIKNQGIPLEMKDETRLMLEEFYRPFNEKLYSLLGQKYDW